MILFGTIRFFVLAAFFPVLIVAYKKLTTRYTPYLLLISSITLIVFYLVYRDSLLSPVLLFCTAFVVLKLVHAGQLRKWAGIIVTLLPLLLLKTNLLSLFAMIGISFTTFRAIDVLIFSDTQYGTDILEYFNYLFFPLTLLAGPLYRWRNYKQDLTRAYSRISVAQSLTGWETLMLGVIQKFAVAELINQLVLTKTGIHDYSARGVFLNASGYSAYLYFDFAGYSNMALGIATMLGFQLPENFRNPIASRNPQDFWKRWHVSLSEWLRDVVFMPIYKNSQKLRFFARHKVTAQNIGIFATLFLMGTWNGLQKDYVISGMLFGSYSVVHNIMVHKARTNLGLTQFMNHRISMATGRLLTLVLAALSLYVFSGRSPI
jgi:membrane protein involved in D-alanine export